ncbi:hypothetical protein ACFZAD_39600 [Streptomyces iakyrus]|uniref:hypothetical protein n=1 Tax=Streptomyces iakyrus TaxID=68219 RepID=UPI0036EFFE05
MSARAERLRREEAQRFLDLLKAQTRAELGDFGKPPDDPATVAAVKDLIERFPRESLSPEQRDDPQIQALLEQVAAEDLHNPDDGLSGMLTQMQDDIETTAIARIDLPSGVDLASRRPLISHLRTGQLNAVSMRVPGRFGAHLVLVEDQMLVFSSKLSKALAWAIPHGPADAEGMTDLQWSVAEARRRIEAVPEVTDRFADLVIAYAVTGNIGNAGRHLLPPGLFNFASMLRDSLEYFVLGHEYAHILIGHLDTTAVRKGVLPAGEAEVLAYSWEQEFEADLLGMVLSLNAGIDHDARDL